MTLALPVVLSVGTYFFAQSENAPGSGLTSASFQIYSVGFTHLMNQNANRAVTSPNPTVAGVMPATLGAYTATSIYIQPVAAFFEV